MARILTSILLWGLLTHSATARRDGWDILNERCSWLTIQDVSEARDSMDPATLADPDHDSDDFPRLTEAQLDAQVIVPDGGTGPWILRHAYADGEGTVATTEMSACSTVRDVLQAIANMTVQEGPNQIEDFVHFEGLRLHSVHQSADAAEIVVDVRVGS